MQLKESLYTASNMRNDPRWKHGDLTRISTLCNQRGVKGNFIECAIRGLQINSSNARKHFDTVRAIANEYLAAREAESPIAVLTPREELKQFRSTATPAVVQKPTTAPVPKQLTGKRLAEARRLLSFTQQQAAENGGVSQRDVSELESDTKVFIPSTYLAFLGRNGILLNAIFNSELDLSLSAVVQNPTTAPGTPPTGTLEKLSEANAQLAEESTALMARNAALEENASYMEAELEKREKDLVEAGKAAEVRNRECEALREANTQLLNEVEELQKQNETTARDLATAYKDRDQLSAMNDRNAERMYEAEAKADELEEDNTRLRTALLEQATCFATTLKALLPQA